MGALSQGADWAGRQTSGLHSQSSWLGKAGGVCCPQGHARTQKPPGAQSPRQPTRLRRDAQALPDLPPVLGRVRARLQGSTPNARPSLNLGTRGGGGEGGSKRQMWGPVYPHWLQAGLALSLHVQTPSRPPIPLAAYAPCTAQRGNGQCPAATRGPRLTPNPFCSFALRVSDWMPSTNQSEPPQWGQGSGFPPPLAHIPAASPSRHRGRSSVAPSPAGGPPAGESRGRCPQGKVPNLVSPGGALNPHRVHKYKPRAAGRHFFIQETRLPRGPSSCRDSVNRRTPAVHPVGGCLSPGVTRRHGVCRLSGTEDRESPHTVAPCRWALPTVGSDWGPAFQSHTYIFTLILF